MAVGSKSKSSFECARCGKRITAWVYSGYTKKRYCRDMDACAKRAKKKENNGTSE